FIINDDYNHNCRYLNSLSLVCKQFLSVTNRLRFSYTVCNSTIISLPISHTVYDSTHSFLRHLFERYTNLNSLNLININIFFIDYAKLLCQISCFPFKLTSLNLSQIPTFPANGLLAFAQKITTLTSLTCSHVHSLNSSDLFLIAEHFPLLEELDLSYPSNCKNSSSYVDGLEDISLALIKLRKRSSCLADEITNAALASALHERPTLKSLSFSVTPCIPEYRQVFTTSHLIDSLVSLKGLTCLDLHYLNISDELLYSIAREGLPLTRLVLQRCAGHSYAGIVCLLGKCQRVQHLNLQCAYFLNDQHVIKLSLYLGDLMSINLSHCWKLTYSALFALVRNCPSPSEIKMERIGSKIVGRSNSLVDFSVYPQLMSLYLGNSSWLRGESIIMFASSFPNLQVLDLNSCNGISEVNIDCRSTSGKNGKGGEFSVLPPPSLIDINVEIRTLGIVFGICPKEKRLVSRGLSGLWRSLVNEATWIELCSSRTGGVEHVKYKEKGVKRVVENCPQLRVMHVRSQKV
ncbi:F-box/LRR-repeat protein, partial [Trifolium medium]|nr:F-box/LRR-repeat protein [Trifolium medium]